MSSFINSNQSIILWTQPKLPMEFIQSELERAERARIAGLRDPATALPFSIFRKILSKLDTETTLATLDVNQNWKRLVNINLIYEERSRKAFQADKSIRLFFKCLDEKICSNELEGFESLLKNKPIEKCQNDIELIRKFNELKQNINSLLFSGFEKMFDTHHTADIPSLNYLRKFLPQILPRFVDEVFEYYDQQENQIDYLNIFNISDALLNMDYINQAIELIKLTIKSDVDYSTSFDNRRILIKTILKLLKIRDFDRLNEFAKYIPNELLILCIQELNSTIPTSPKEIDCVKGIQILFKFLSHPKDICEGALILSHLLEENKFKYIAMAKEFAELISDPEERAKAFIKLFEVLHSINKEKAIEYIENASELAELNCDPLKRCDLFNKIAFASLSKGEIWRTHANVEKVVDCAQLLPNAKDRFRLICQSAFIFLSPQHNLEMTFKNMQIDTACKYIELAKKVGNEEDLNFLGDNLYAIVKKFSSSIEQKLDQMEDFDLLANFIKLSRQIPVKKGRSDCLFNFFLCLCTNKHCKDNFHANIIEFINQTQDGWFKNELLKIISSL